MPPPAGRAIDRSRTDRVTNTGGVTFRERGMYSSIRIRDFRSFTNVAIDQLGSVNLIFGPNNSGKTSILEAIFTHASGTSFRPVLAQVAVRRFGMGVRGPLDMGERIISIFNRHDIPPYTFEISARILSDPKEHTLNVKFFPSAELADLDPRNLGPASARLPAAYPPEKETASAILDNFGSKVTIRTQQSSSVSLGDWVAGFDNSSTKTRVSFAVNEIQSEAPFKLAIMHDILSHREPDAEVRVFSYLKRYSILDDFIQEMRHVFQDITDIDMLPYPDGTTGPLYVTMGDGRNVPLYAFGDGARRWFYLLGHMLVNQRACHCIEEIDSTLHPGAYGDLSRLLLSYSERFQNQLFLTSHSIEFADAFLNALYGEEGSPLANAVHDPVRIFTIRKSDSSGIPEIWPLSGREAFEARQRYELELRS